MHFHYVKADNLNLLSFFTNIKMINIQKMFLYFWKQLMKKKSIIVWF